MAATIWTSNISDDTKKGEFIYLLQNSTLVLGRLSDIIREKGYSLNRSEESLETYDSPGWACKQAHLNGKRAAYKEILMLLQKDPTNV